MAVRRKGWFWTGVVLLIASAPNWCIAGWATADKDTYGAIVFFIAAATLTGIGIFCLRRGRGTPTTGTIRKVSESPKRASVFAGRKDRRKLWLALVIVLIVATGLLGYHLFSPVISAGQPQTVISPNWIAGKSMHQVSLLEGNYYFLTLEAKGEASPEQVRVKVSESGTNEIFLDRVYEREYSSGYASPGFAKPPYWFYTGDEKFICIKTGTYEVVSHPIGEGLYSLKLVQSGRGTRVWYADVPLYASIWFSSMGWVPWLIKSRMSINGLLRKPDKRLVNALSAEGWTLFALSIVLLNIIG